MAKDNSTIMHKIWERGTNDFQQRIPDPDQAGIAQTIENLMQPMNGKYFNEFMDALINRVGFTYVRQMAWDNPLAVFKDGMMTYGSTIQEIAPKWIKAHSYIDDVESLLKLHRPDAEVWYHSIDRADVYPISVNEMELRQAFTDEYGLNKLIAGIMDVPRNSDNYDEYLIMKQLIGEYENRLGFYKHKLTAAPTDETTGKELLTAIRTYVGRLKFPSTLYNAASITDVPVFAKPDDLVLFVTPETDASLDVNTLAVLFNLDKADIQVRKIVLDEFPIPNAVALLTTSDFFVCKDTVYRTESFYNPSTLSTTYFLHHQGIYSISPFVPSVLFTTDAGTEKTVATQTVTGFSITADPATANPGDIIQLVGTIQGSTDYAPMPVAPDSFTCEVSCTRGEEGVQLNSRTYVDRLGRLHIQKSGLQSGDIIKVDAVSTYMNPSAAPQTPYKGSTTVTIA